MVSGIFSKLAAFTALLLLFAGTTFAEVSIDTSPAITPDNSGSAVLSGASEYAASSTSDTVALPDSTILIIPITDHAEETTLATTDISTSQEIETASLPATLAESTDVVGTETVPAISPVSINVEATEADIVPATLAESTDVADTENVSDIAAIDSLPPVKPSTSVAKISGITASPSLQINDLTYVPGTYELLAFFSFSSSDSSKVTCEYTLNGKDWLPAKLVLVTSGIISTASAKDDVSGTCVAKVEKGEGGPVSMRANKRSPQANP
ncbi:MAG: hypothetical protein NTX79_04120 [Candidatus Micrarchaeota archaeon]|nr:hypothetical protein [Candidatus Micrarchaeota archaeon]